MADNSRVLFTSAVIATAASGISLIISARAFIDYDLEFTATGICHWLGEQPWSNWINLLISALGMLSTIALLFDYTENVLGFENRVQRFLLNLLLLICIVIVAVAVSLQLDI